MFYFMIVFKCVALTLLCKVFVSANGPETVWFNIVSLINTQLVLDAEDDEGCSKDKVIFSRRDSSSLTQMWKYEDHMIINKRNRMALDVKEKNISHPLILFPPCKTINQKWRLSQLDEQTNIISFLGDGDDHLMIQAGEDENEVAYVDYYEMVPVPFLLKLEIVETRC